MSLTSDSERPAPGGGMEQPRDGDVEETHHVSLGMYLRCRYWGRLLIYTAMHAILLGLVDVVVPILNWQLCLLGACLVAVLSARSYRQLVWTFVLLLPAAAVQIAMFADRPLDPQRTMIMVMSLALAGFVVHAACTRQLRDQPPHRVMLNLVDGRQIPLLVGDVPCEAGPHGWQAVSASGRIYLTDGWTVSHAGGRRHTVVPVVYHDEHGRAYVPDLHGLRDTL